MATDNKPGAWSEHGIWTQANNALAKERGTGGWDSSTFDYKDRQRWLIENGRGDELAGAGYSPGQIAAMSQPGYFDGSTSEQNKAKLAATRSATPTTPSPGPGWKWNGWSWQKGGNEQGAAGTSSPSSTDPWAGRYGQPHPNQPAGQNAADATRRYMEQFGGSAHLMGSGPHSGGSGPPDGGETPSVANGGLVQGPDGVWRIAPSWGQGGGGSGSAGGAGGGTARTASPSFSVQKGAAPQQFQRQAYEVPPPPKPPVIQPPKLAAGNVDFMKFVNGMQPLGALPRFQAPQVGEMGRAPEYQRPDAPGAAPNFAELARMRELGPMPEWRQPKGPGAAPDFLSLAAGAGSAAEGPRYSTAEGSWMGENLLADMEAFAREGMDESNRFLSPAVQAARDSFKADRARYKDDATGGIEELMASRGLTGSNFEVQDFSELEDRLDENTLGFDADLLKWMADTESGDRASALASALGVGQFGQSLGNDRRSEGQFKHTADRQTTRDLEDDRRYRTDTNLAAGELTNAAEMDRARFGLDSEEARFQSLLDSLGLQSDDNARRAELGLEGGRAQDEASRWRSLFEADTSQAEFDNAFKGAEFRERGAMERARFGLEGERLRTDSDFRNAQLRQLDATERAALGLQAGELTEDSRFREFESLLEGNQFLSDQEFRNATLQETGNIDRANLNQQGQEIDLRAHQIQQEAISRGQELSLEEAKARAANELGSRELDIRAREAAEARKHREFLELLGYYDLLGQGVPGGVDPGKADAGANPGNPPAHLSDPNRRPSTPPAGESADSGTWIWNGSNWQWRAYNEPAR